MFTLSKLAITLISPLGTCFALVALGVLLGWIGWRRCARVSLFAGLGWLLLWSLPTPSYWLRASLENHTPQRAATAYRHADVIIVLGGGMSGRVPGHVLRPQLSDAADRVWFAARLYKADRAPLLILSSGSGPPDAQLESQAMAELLTALGLPRSALLLESRSRNTWQNALYTAQLMQAQDLDTALLVTSALHMPRALATFRHQGIEVMPAAVDFSTPPRGSWPQRWLPQAGALAASSRAMKEYVGLWVYRWRGFA